LTEAALVRRTTAACRRSDKEADVFRRATIVGLAVVGWMVNTLPAAAAAGTIYGCANSHGRVRLITTSPPTCRATETSVSWNQQGPKGDPGPRGPGLVVKDVNGALVGLVVSAGPRPIIERTIGGENVLLIVDPNGFLDATVIGDSVGKEFESADCSGQMYGFVSFPALFHFGSVHLGVGYYPTGPNLVRTIQSTLFFSSAQTCATAHGVVIPPDGCCTPITPQPDSVAAVATFDLSTLGLVPPFHVEGP
jgi:hypothetical protein